MQIVELSDSSIAVQREGQPLCYLTGQAVPADSKVKRVLKEVPAHEGGTLNAVHEGTHVAINATVNAVSIVHENAADAVLVQAVKAGRLLMESTIEAVRNRPRGGGRKEHIESIEEALIKGLTEEQLTQLLASLEEKGGV